MALKIRLRRMGRKKAPHYRIVVAESSMPRDGRFVAKVGHYNPTTTPATLVVDRDKALQWMGKGAMPTETVQSLFKKAGVFGPAPTVVEQAAEAVTPVTASAACSTTEGAGLNTPACLSSDCTVSVGMAPLPIHASALSRSTTRVAGLVVGL